MFAVGKWNNFVNDRSGVFFSSIERAEINANGTLGSWQIVSNMTIPRTFHGTAILYPFVYVTGGASPNASGRLASVEFSTLDGIGGLSPWQAATPMTTIRGEHPTVTAQGHVYVLGGNGPSPTDNVIRAKIE